MPYSLQNWGLVCWEAACMVWGLKSFVTVGWCFGARVVHWKVNVTSSLADVWQQLVWAARHHSNSSHVPFTFTPGCMKTMHTSAPSAWRHRLKPKRKNMFIRSDKRGMSMSWIDIWLKYGQQPADLHWSIDRSVARLFYCVPQIQKQTLWTFAILYDVTVITVMTFKAYTTAVMNKLT